MRVASVLSCEVQAYFHALESRHFSFQRCNSLQYSFNLDGVGRFDKNKVTNHILLVFRITALSMCREHRVLLVGGDFLLWRGRQQRSSSVRQRLTEVPDALQLKA